MISKKAKKYTTYMFMLKGWLGELEFHNFDQVIPSLLQEA